MIKSYILIAILTLLMIGALIYGVMASGSPFEVRSKKFDTKRVSDLSEIYNQIDGYYSRTSGILPDNLSTLKKEYPTLKNITDPETGTEYEYKKVSRSSFKLCANFSTDQDEKNTGQSLYYGSNKFKYSKGYQCFDLTPTIIQQTYNQQAYSNNQAVTQYPEPSIAPEVLSQRARDSARLKEIIDFQTIITNAVFSSGSINYAKYCEGDKDKQAPCFGTSLTDSRKADGTGWIKINLSSQIAELPVDPINDSKYHYIYCADEDEYEIDFVLESSSYASDMKNDHGDDDNKYELGTNLKLVGNTPNCKY